jgi:hypothetical protein
MAAETRTGAERFAIDFVANPIQGQFIRSHAEADYWSARMGEGKSAGLCWAIFHHAQENPGAWQALVRDTFETLRDTTMKEFFHWFPPGIVGEYKIGEKLWKWNIGGLEGGEVSFLGMDDPKDASKLQSRALGGVFFDELAPASESGGIDPFIFDTAHTRLRQKGMRWYANKSVSNNPDESHWSYNRFVDPGDAGTPPGAKIAEMQERGFRFHRADTAENAANLPPGYYARLKQSLRHRPDLVRRFVDGEFGFQQVGKSVTPEWSDRIHLVQGLVPVKRVPLLLCWDFGLNPTCIITQFTPLGHWLILEAHVGDGIGAYELIEQIIKPTMASVYDGFQVRHTGDPMGSQREQSSSKQSAVGVIKRELGGRWTPGPVRIPERVNPLRWALSQIRNGTGLLQVNKDHAEAVYFALRGGWHHHTSRTGTTNETPKKNEHSHPGDAMGYGAALLFPNGQVTGTKKTSSKAYKGTNYFGSRGRAGLGMERPGAKIPKEAKTLGRQDGAESWRAFPRGK